MISATESRINFFFETPVTLRDRVKLKKALFNTLKKNGRQVESLNYIFCTDERLLEINRQYLQHDYYTDIISFELSIPSQPLVGEIYISIDRVRDNAKQHNQTITRELHRVIVHGVLHFCGFKDKTSAEEKEMRAAEEKFLASYLRK
ncbi:MAG: rRNA maturation RNase YbeY [Chitinophagaceae bacterium]|nr:rRNA maturation RNase YbeY [Chitinophagaceae bacterium]